MLTPWPRALVLLAPLLLAQLAIVSALQELGALAEGRNTVLLPPDPTQEQLRQALEQLHTPKHHQLLRLKAGDPVLFEDSGSLARELRLYGSLGGRVARVLPGVSAALAAPLLAGIPLTHRGLADQVWFGTGAAAEGEGQALPEPHPRLSLVILGAAASVAQVTQALSARAWSDDTPAAIVEAAGTEAQHVVIGSVAALPRLAAEHGVREPATLVFGGCVRVLHEGTWHGAVNCGPLGPPDLLAPPPAPSVTLIGAGPGEAGHLTVAGARALAAADLVIADRLVDPGVVALARAGADVRVPDSKKGGAMDAVQANVSAWAREGAARGLRVARLKIGDPFLFGRGGEEALDARASCGVDALVLPGVSSALAAPLLAGIPLTLTTAAAAAATTSAAAIPAVWVGSGVGVAGARAHLPRHHPGLALVLLMAVSRLGELCQELVAVHAWPPETPAAVIERAATPAQRAVRAPLGELARRAAEAGAAAPAVVVVGECAAVNLLE